MKTLHEEFYEFRDKVWKSFEKLVQEGCEITGELTTGGDPLPMQIIPKSVVEIIMGFENKKQLND